MKKIVNNIFLITIFLYIFGLCVFASGNYKPNNLKAELDLNNNRKIKVFWNNDDEFLSNINNGVINDAKIVFDIQLDSRGFFSTQNRELFSSSIENLSFDFDPFYNEILNTENTMVTIRARYEYVNNGKKMVGDFTDSVQVGNSSFVNNVSSWAKDSIEKANSLGLLSEKMKSDATLPITRFDFVKSLMKMDNYISSHQVKIEKVFLDVDDKDISLAYNLGIVNGISNDHFDSNSNITREQIAVIIDRYLKILSKNVVSNDELLFSDKENISSWAVPMVRNINTMGIMSGNDKNLFEPKKNISVEESVSIIMRVFNLF